MVIINFTAAKPEYEFVSPCFIYLCLRLLRIGFNDFFLATRYLSDAVCLSWSNRLILKRFLGGYSGYS